ncbi:hypothetical protein BJX65DRAFT_211229 [Aspergillus insuetus]
MWIQSRKRRRTVLHLWSLSLAQAVTLGKSRNHNAPVGKSRQALVQERLDGAHTALISPPCEDCRLTPLWPLWLAFGRSCISLVGSRIAIMDKLCRR